MLFMLNLCILKHLDHVVASGFSLVARQAEDELEKFVHVDVWRNQKWLKDLNLIANVLHRLLLPVSAVLLYLAPDESDNAGEAEHSQSQNLDVIHFLVHIIYIEEVVSDFKPAI